MYKAKQFKKANNYEFLWIKDGNIFLKKAKDTKAINVNVSTDFSKLNKLTDLLMWYLVFGVL